MRICYVDMVGGAAGDMLLAAFLDAGADRDAIERALRTVVPDGWTLEPERTARRGIAATFAGLVVPGEDGDAEHHHHHEHGHAHVHADDRGGASTRTLAGVLDIVERSGLTARQRERASAVYRRLADAEAHTHGTTADRVAFHEVGQIDAILDVAATCVALDVLQIDELRVSPFPIGSGAVDIAHGTYPNPPPATAHLLIGWPTRAVDVRGEMVTPTAAAILTTLGRPGRVDMTIERIGYGAGRSDFPIPNVTRVVIGTADAARARAASPDAEDAQDVVVIEANIDDMSPQHYELAIERLFAAGALDVWLTPIVMKKSRPAITLSVLGAPRDEHALARVVLTETTTIGVRVRSERRHVLPRTVETIDTPLGAVRVKRAGANGAARARAEYDDVVRIARERAVPLNDVLRIVEQRIAERDGAEPAS